ncbi:DUF421 domain-containing protein [Pedobacter chinensis]|uniref:DUF421 domain-containing protein n=1 Tax=Pedobacter chinensis TaxID=2282421 RepID=A0A369PY93_9SPHI|nr:YetF domain-containing protein [Pedobacter chinensis]RDC55957.1 DUF421 domain-containing protein [Pedobacter chinensis]
MDNLMEIIGTGRELTELQMCIRAMIVFVVAYFLIRISGRRSFGQHGPMDNIIVILLGAILSRAVVGASPFLAVLAASILLVMLHRLLGWVVSKDSKLSEIIEGRKILLYEKDSFMEDNMARSLIGKEEVYRAMRQNLGTEDLAQVDKIFMEKNGQISIVKKKCQ